MRKGTFIKNSDNFKSNALEIGDVVFLNGQFGEFQGDFQSKTGKVFVHDMQDHIAGEGRSLAFEHVGLLLGNSSSN